ncbi:MAG: vitamin K epoxide reductase family protein [Gammaproteobacteria bacterium]
MVAKREVVLITGISGAIGAALSDVLAEQFRVIGLDQDCSNRSTDCLSIDISSEEAVDTAMSTLKTKQIERIASVVHLAAFYDFSGGPNPLYEEVNVDGTRHLLRALQSFEVEQFVYSSTMLVHAPMDPGVAIDEDAPLDPAWTYPQSKLETENVVREEHCAIPFVILRIAGVYTDRGQVPTLSHQIRRIYERTFTSGIFAGDPSHGQAFVYIGDLVDAMGRVIERRAQLPRECTLLIGEPATMSYEALQNQIGTLIHGEQWETMVLPKPIAETGAWLQQKLEPVIPDAIDKGEEPFIKPFMVDLADAHYELDISRARELLEWMPRHSLRDTLPKMVQALKDDPVGWYQDNHLTAPESLEGIAAADKASGRALDAYARLARMRHRQTLWAHFINMGLGLWLITSPMTMAYQSVPLAISDIVSGGLVFYFGALSLSWRMAWARLATATVGLWLLFAPLVFWAPTAAAYLNDTLVGSLVIGFSFLVRPAVGVGAVAEMSGSDVPPGWEYSPSSWTQRLPIICLAFVGLFISRYLAAYQLGHTENAWDPFFGEGTERIITSEVSKAWPVPDAGLGAVTYMLEILTGIIGDRRRWRTMPWLVILFGIMIVPLGAVSIFFIIIQPIVIGTWCTLCLIAAAAMLVQIPYSLDELIATGQFLAQRFRHGKSLLIVFFKGDTMEGARQSGPENLDLPPSNVLKEMWTGGVSSPWNLLLSALVGVWLMGTRLVFDTQAPMAHSDHLLGALVITVSITALAEVARPVRFINALFGICLMGAPWMLEGGSPLADWAGVLAGLLLVLLSIPKGKVSHGYGGWSKYIV